METNVISFQENEPLTKAAQVFVEHEYLVYPVVNRISQMIGILSLEALKNLLSNPDSWAWLLVSDVMRPMERKVFSSSALAETLDQMYELTMDQIPVIKHDNGDVPVGLLDVSKAKERIDIEVFRRRQAIEYKRSRGNKKDGKNVSSD